MSKHFDLFIKSKVWSQLQNKKWEPPGWYLFMQIMFKIFVHWLWIMFIFIFGLTIIVGILIGIYIGYLKLGFKDDTAFVSTAVTFVFLVITFVITLIKEDVIDL